MTPPLDPVSPGHPDAAANADDLQLDRVEYAHPTDGETEAQAITSAPAGPVCASCHREIADAYYEVNGQILCDPCRSAIEAHLGRPPGWGIVRFLRALVFGVAGGAVGCLVYFAVLKLTGMQAGLISILVGFLVGRAVQIGSRHRGGWLYQALAIILSYSAIVCSFAVNELPELLTKQAQQFDAIGAGRPVPEEGGLVTVKWVPGQPLKVSPARRSIAAVLLVVVVVGYSFAFPFTGGMNLIGLAIIFFALQQAWRLNKRPRLAIQGPFQIGGLGDAPAPAHA